MARTLIARLGAGCAACLFALGASAGAWQADGKDGRLEFTAVQAGAKFTGRFTDFRVALVFDAARPAEGRLRVTVATRSVETEDDDRDGILQSDDFFASGAHPEAVYEAAGFERDGQGWLARGQLTLRGVTRPVLLRFTTAPAKDRLAMRGRATLARLAFGVGQGDWRSTEWIGDEVAIAFDLGLRPDAAAASP